MIDKNEMAKLLAACSGYYNSRQHLALDERRQRAACRDLHSYNVLSLSAIAAVVGCSVYHVRQHIKGLISPSARGTLNPQHLPWLAYMLDGKVRDTWVHNMVREGTSLSTIEDITGISRSTLNRRK